MTSNRWWRDGPALPPPAPPAGLGPRLGSWTEGRWARRRLFLKVLLALAVLWAVGALSHPTPPAYGFGLATLLATWLLLVYANPVVREAFLAAGRRSRAAGMTANRGTSATLSLDGK